MRAAAALLLLAAAETHAQCRALEFAELESMRPDQVLALRCTYSKEMNDWAKIAGTGDLRQGARALGVANQCAGEITRLERMLARRLPVQGDDAAVTTQLNAMCRAAAK